MTRSSRCYIRFVGSYLFEFLLAFGSWGHCGVRVLQPLAGLGIERQAGGGRGEGVLHHGGGDVDGVGRNGHTFAPAQLHLKIHDHLA